MLYPIWGQMLEGLSIGQIIIRMSTGMIVPCHSCDVKLTPILRKVDESLNNVSS